jgi:hypothetical protein
VNLSDTPVAECIARQYTIPGAQLSVVVLDEDAYEIRAIIGEQLGRDIVVWRTRIEASEILTSKNDHAGITDAISRPIAALAKLCNDAQERGFEAGVKEGERRAREAIGNAAKILGEALGLQLAKPAKPVEPWIP